MKSTISKAGRILAWVMSAGLLLPAQALADGSDNFDDNSKNTSKWGNDVMLSLGELHEQNTHLEFICDNPASNDDTLRPWIAERFPVNADWSVQVDVFNSTVPFQDFQVDAAGMRLISPLSADTELDLEFYASSLGAPNSTRKGFDADMEVEDEKIGDTDTGSLAGTETVNGAMRIEYTGATKVAEFFYDLDIMDGYQWTFIASYGIAGSGGSTTNANWGLSNSDQLTFYLWGYSDGMFIEEGELYLDNFVETGGVPSSGGPAPVPTGSFSFGFPTNNPLLAAIASITGNYAGIDPFGSDRSYGLDVAQDEEGKVTAMGMVDGIANAEGGSELSTSGGALSTVNDKPTLDLKSSFTGSADGFPVTGKGDISGPVEIMDIGSGTNGVAVTASGSGSAAGIPVSISEQPVMFASTPDMESNFSKDWSLNLNISTQTVKGKQVTVASAQLTLPNGDVIEYPERKVKYSTTKGYKLKLKKGMNVTMDPPAPDKSAISITGLTFVQEGDDWVPTGGTIIYQFLGQEGTADVLDFVSQ